MPLPLAGSTVPQDRVPWFYPLQGIIFFWDIVEAVTLGNGILVTSCSLKLSFKSAVVPSAFLPVLPKVPGIQFLKLWGFSVSLTFLTASLGLNLFTSMKSTLTHQSAFQFQNYPFFFFIIVVLKKFLFCSFLKIFRRDQG